MSNVTSAATPERAPSGAVQAGRAFKLAFDDLGRGDQARLRRAEDPLTVGAFWVCFHAAKQRHDHAYPPLYGQVVPFLDLLKQGPGITDFESTAALNVGRFLALHRSRVALRRVEALLGTEHFEELLDGLESVFTLLKGSSFDFGRLLADLASFDYSIEARNQVRQHWASAYFQHS